jgi:hypothetical protein
VTIRDDFAEAVLEAAGRRLGLSVRAVRLEPPGGEPVWRIEGESAGGERWSASHPRFYRALVMLGDLVANPRPRKRSR